RDSLSWMEYSITVEFGVSSGYELPSRFDTVIACLSSSPISQRMNTADWPVRVGS
ncbi:hypothetical protein J6590_073672, partial [Homalodisca vitripennis]